MITFNFYVLLICIALIFSGCDTSDSILKSQYSNEYKINYHNADAQAFCEEVQVYFETNNLDTIENLFSSYTKEKHDVASELENAMEFIDGDIISYGEADGVIFSKYAEDGQVKMVKFIGDIKNIKTDTGKEYLINYSYYPIHDDGENFVGFDYISVYWRDEYTQENNYPEYAKFQIGEVY